MNFKYLSVLLIGTAISITSCLQQNVEKKDAKVNEVGADKKVAQESTQKTDKWAQYRGHAIEFDRIVTKYKSEDEALQDMFASGDVLVDFYADWCGPCKQMGPNFTGAAQKFNTILFVKINVDKYQNIIRKYDVKSMPTLMYVKAGTDSYKAEKVSGYRTEAQIAQLLRQ